MGKAKFLRLFPVVAPKYTLYTISYTSHILQPIFVVSSATLAFSGVTRAGRTAAKMAAISEGDVAGVGDGIEGVLGSNAGKQAQNFCFAHRQAWMTGVVANTVAAAYGFDSAVLCNERQPRSNSFRCEKI